MKRAELMLIFYSTAERDGIAQLHKDVQLVRENGVHNHFLDEYIYGPKPYDESKAVQFNAWGFRLVQSLNKEAIGYRFRGSLSAYLETNLQVAFYEMIQKICFYYALDYVLLVDDEESGVFVNTDDKKLFFDEEKQRDLVS